MDFYNYVLGLGLLIFGVAYFIYTFNKKEKITKKDGMAYASQVKKNMAVLGLIAVGLMVLFMELKKIM